MGNLAKELRKHDLKRVRAYCGECDYEFLDTKKELYSSVIILEAELDVLAKQHREEMDHLDVQVDIDTFPKREELDVEVTVN